MRPVLVCIVMQLAAAFVVSEANAARVEFAGKPVLPGTTITAEVALNAAEKSFASDAAKNVPDHAVAVLGIPRNFDPHRKWPVLVVFSTSDFRRLNRYDLVDFYRDAGLSQGWVILAGDGRDFPPRDTNGWRVAMTLAALDELHKSFPGSARWPVAVAGFSGGAKRASLLAPLLFLKRCRICGIYLAGVNEDFLSISYRTSRLGQQFLDIPVFISSGTNDTIAPPDQARAVAGSIKAAGFRNVRFEPFSGGHVVKNDHTLEALRWFRARGTGF